MRAMSMKQIWIFSSLVVGSLAFAQQNNATKDRKPTSDCKFTISSIVVRSDSAVEEIDSVNDKIVQTYPELSDFSEMLPNSVTLKVKYTSQGCRDAMVAQIALHPTFVKGGLAKKPWFTREDKLVNLKPNGELILSEVPVLEYYETLTPENWVNASTFTVVMIEGKREVAKSSVTVPSPLGH
jgi:hypothetical protein